MCLECNVIVIKMNIFLRDIKSISWRLNDFHIVPFNHISRCVPNLIRLFIFELTCLTYFVPDK